MKERFKVDFIGIGTPKSGTTWLVECLREHPEIYIPVQKEINFFDSTEKNSNYAKGLGWYRHFFRRAAGYMKIGEFTTHYMFQNESAILIRKHFPQAKLIACLRNPTDMMYSFYWWLKANVLSHSIPHTFEKSIEEKAIDLNRGMYCQQLKTYFEYFPSSNIKIILFDDIRRDPVQVIHEVYTFLDVDADYIPHSSHKKVNRSKVVRHKRLACLAALPIETLQQLNLDGLARSLMSNVYISHIYSKLNKKEGNYPPISKGMDKMLREFYKSDVENLEGLIRRDLSSWKKAN